MAPPAVRILPSRLRDPATPRVARAEGQVCAPHPTTATPTRPPWLSNGGTLFHNAPHLFHSAPYPPSERPNHTEECLGNLLIPYRGAPTAGNRGTAVLSSYLVAGRGIRTRCGASCPCGSLDRGGCGLVVGDDTPWCPRSASIPLGRRPLPATPPPAAPVAVVRCACRQRLPSAWKAAGVLAAATVLPSFILEDVMPRRKPASSQPDPAPAALLQPLTPHAAGIAIGATELGVCVPPSAVASPAAPSAPAVLPPPSAASEPSRPTCTPLRPGCGSAR